MSWIYIYYISKRGVFKRNLKFHWPENFTLTKELILFLCRLLRSRYVLTLYSIYCYFWQLKYHCLL